MENSLIATVAIVAVTFSLFPYFISILGYVDPYLTAIKELKSKVPKNFRSPYWYGIAKRARIIYYAPERVSQDELKGCLLYTSDAADE